MTPSNNPSDDSTATVVIIDDDSAIRNALKGLLESVGLRAEPFGSVAEFLATAQPNRSGCFVLDVRLPGRSGLEFHSDLTRAGIQLPVIFISGFADVQMSVDAMKSGALEFLVKPVRAQELLHAVQRAIALDTRQRAEREDLASIRTRFERLTDREREVMTFVAQGCANKRIARELGLTEATIKVHRGRLMQKMKAATIVDLVRIADKVLKSP